MPFIINDLPDTEYLMECFIYDPNSGDLIWKYRPVEHFKNQRGYKCFNSNFANKKAGTENHGYLIIKLDGTLYRAHRIVYALVHGDCPNNFEIDHINGDKLNNKISNLRLASRNQNMKNIKIYKNNTSGFIGVRWYKKYNKWTASAGRKNLGYFYLLEDAVKARDEYVKSTNGLFAVLNKEIS